MTITSKHFVATTLIAVAVIVTAWFSTSLLNRNSHPTTLTGTIEVTPLD